MPEYENIARLVADARRDFEKQFRPVAEKDGLRVVSGGFASAARGGTFAAGFPVEDSQNDPAARALLYLDLPDLGECSELLPPGFYLLRVSEPDGRAELKGSSGKRVRVNRLTFETSPPSAPAPRGLRIDLGGGTADVCVPYSEEDRTIVYMRLSDSEPDT